MDVEISSPYREKANANISPLNKKEKDIKGENTAKN